MLDEETETQRNSTYRIKLGLQSRIIFCNRWFACVDWIVRGDSCTHETTTS